MFLNAYKIHRTHFCSLLQNTTCLLTPKTRKKKKKGRNTWSKYSKPWWRCVWAVYVCSALYNSPYFCAYLKPSDARPHTGVGSSPWRGRAWLHLCRNPPYDRLEGRALKGALGLGAPASLCCSSLHRRESPVLWSVVFPSVLAHGGACPREEEVICGRGCFQKCRLNLTVQEAVTVPWWLPRDHTKTMVPVFHCRITFSEKSKRRHELMDTCR